MRLRWVAAPLLAAVLVALAPVAPAWAADGELVVSGVQTQPGIVTFALTGRNLPDGVSLDPAAVVVKVNQTQLRTEITPATSVAGATPRALMLVVDTMGVNGAADLAAARSAVAALVAALPADVKVGVVSVGAEVRDALAPTTDRAALTAVVAGLAADGFASLGDGIMSAANTLRSGGFGPGDRRVLLLSSAKDTNSGLADPAVREALASLVVPVDAVAVAPTAGATQRLKTYVDPSQGRLLAAPDAASVNTLAASVARSFAPVFAVTAYVPAQFGGVTTTLAVEAAGVTGSALVAFGPSVPGLKTSDPSVLGLIPSWVVYVLAGFVFIATILVAVAIAWPRSSKHARIKQIEHFGPAARAAPVKVETPGQPNGLIARTAIAATATMVRSGDLEQRIATRLERGGIKLRPAEWVLLRACITFALALVLFAFTDWIGALIGVLVGLLGTSLFATLRVDRREGTFAEQLPDALQLVIGSLKSGFSLPQALESLVRESPEPVASEFGRAVAEHRLGADVSDALERVAERTRSDDLSWAVMAVRIQREVGGNLAEVLQTTVDTMRERGRLRRHVRALSAEGRVSAWVLIALPIGLAAFMFIYRREYLAPLVTDPNGVLMLATGSALFLVGIIWMLRVIKVEA